MLTPQQIQFYRDSGYLGVENVFSPAEVEELRRVTDEFVEQSRAVTANDAVFDLEPSHTPEVPRLRRLKDPSSTPFTGTPSPTRSSVPSSAS